MNLVRPVYILIFLVTAVFSAETMISIDSVHVDSVWNSDSAWYEGSTTQQQRTSRDCLISFIPQGHENLMFRIFLALSTDAGETWTSDSSILTVPCGALQYLFWANRKHTITARVMGGDRENVAFRVTGRQYRIDTANASSNLVFNDGQWRPSVDSHGSTFDTGTVFISDEAVKVVFTITQRTGNFWPYVELICALGRRLTEVNGMEVSYRTDRPLKVKLSQSDFGPDGIGTYAHYEYTIPAVEDWETVRLRVDHFEQPSWADEQSRAIPLNMNNVQDIYFVPDLDYTTGDTGTLEIRSFILYGYE